MQGQIISINGKTYNRQVEMLGDVEKITWFEYINEQSEQEIYDQDEMHRLEEAYETILFATLMPNLPII